ncbi:TetR family transcriptional regulator [Micromonospora sp. NPDC049374]|uniref:TetR/AcrR family transcriptional regulator n=1 Tax=Micromonospora sp. NPDC049374 TaxID=3154352 RepID=UPI00341D9038
MTEGVPERAQQPVAEPAADGGRRDDAGPAASGAGRRSTASGGGGRSPETPPGGGRRSPETPPGGGRRSSEATRAAILRAARDRFAADGYDRATIRAIAADARIDPSMVMRYYGSKENLFATAAEFDLRLPDLSGVPADRLGTALVSYFFTRWEGDSTLPALLRTASTNPSGAERVRAIFATQLGVAVGRVVADPDEAPRRAGLVASQLLGVALTRYVLRLPPMVDISPTELITWLAPTIQRYLRAPAPR